MIVVDASVAVKWFIPEAGEEDAAQLLGGKTHLMAPALIRLEVAGAIIRRYREGHLSEKRAREGTQAWDAMLQNRVVRLVPDAELFEDAVQMALLAKHTLGDCLYLAAAKQVAVPVITADVAMRDRGTHAYKNITFLGGAEKP
jgi:predicted nucleic acid-binding protein